jgi:potassium-dependent mechanosensitive channel
LAERPIRVGDLVVVGGEQGCVRKISVRSTELETFDRANVLIPNSYFISEKVKNWTFRNNVSRVSIAVGVAYGSDARQVQAALLAVAQKHPEVLTMPAPSVTLDEFAAANITFTLYAFIGDVAKSGAIRTDLAIAMLDAFAEAGIAIPSGRNEITIRNIDGLREMIAQNAAPPAGKSAGNGGGKSRHEADTATADVPAG